MEWLMRTENEKNALYVVENEECKCRQRGEGQTTNTYLHAFVIMTVGRAVNWTNDDDQLLIKIGSVFAKSRTQLKRRIYTMRLALILK
jgi:hypothetical protein